MPGKRKIKLAIASLLAVSAVATVFAYSISHSPAKRTAPGHVASSAIVPIEGRVLTTLVHTGDQVQKGQLIAVLDSSSYESALKEATAQLQQLQAQEQNAIKPMEALPTMTGFLPRFVTKPELVTIPAKPATAPKPALTAARAPEPKPPVEDVYKKASGVQQGSRNALDKATQDVAKATAALADAQKARDVLRPKITQADTDATQAEKKAAASNDLLTAGVISAKRAQELIDNRDATKKALQEMKAQVAAADKALSDAQAQQQVAQAALDKCSLALKAADENLVKASAEQPKAAEPVTPQAKPKPVAPKPAETRIVMRRMPMIVRHEDAPAIPLKVFVDEKAMQSSQQQIELLQRKIADLKAAIAACQVVAPVAGRIEITPSGDVRITS
jgi:hypothetical protein